MVPNETNQIDNNGNIKVIPLITLKNGEKGKIVNIFGGRHMNQRLNDLGLTAGTIIAIEREAPLGGPYSNHSTWFITRNC